MVEEALRSDWFSKPGDTLRSLMQRKGVDADRLAGSLEGGKQTVRQLLEGTLAINEALASAIATALGGSSEFWLKRQANYEAAVDRAVEANMIHHEEWMDRVPAPGSKSPGEMTEKIIKAEIRRRMVFFNTATLTSWNTRYGQLCQETRFRTSQAFSSSDAATLLWLRRGELEADAISTGRWDPEALRSILPEIRKLSRVSKPSRFLPKLRALFARAGVAFVVVRAPQGCRASGASRLVSSDKAMVLVSFRHRSDDQFWFTVLHEVGHLLLHEAAPFVDGEATPDDEQEQEANAFASDCLVPPVYRERLLSLGNDFDAIVRFSKEIGIGPGLTVGQLQHSELLAHNQLSSLKRRWTWAEIDPAPV